MEPDSIPLRLSYLSERYDKNLPQVISVTEAIYGSYEDLLEDGQEFEVYFKKETPVFSMRMADKTYTVPLNSTFMFSVLYNPKNEDLSIARRGYNFPTVADLMKADPLPTVVYVGRDCVVASKKKSRKDQSILKGQILLILEAINKPKSKTLKCLIIGEASKEVFLDEACEGCFSTKESLLLFPLPKIAKCIKRPFMTSMYLSDGKILHPKFRNRHGMIDTTELSSVGSFICSTNLPSSRATSLVEIFVTVSVMFCVNQKNEAELATLNDNSILLSEKLTPDQISAVIFDSTATTNLLQNDLLLPQHISNWLDEVILTKRTPPRVHQIYESLEPFTDKQFDQNEASPSMSVQSSVDTHSPPPLPPRRSMILSPPSPLMGPVQVATLNNCAYGVAKLQKSPVHAATEAKQPESKIGQYFDTNKRLLADYNVSKIGEFLGLMGLKQYAATFSHELVDGKLFFELDDVMLEEDLGITSKLHRLRMMRIIRGEQHVNDFLTI
ncbi:PREDICTED: uncharacterized protein LOC109586808 [Amphimedon queenslandica]|uniref:SAM domain-containing protein n=2 Tax=Amphimedon queenslandica TaxID=400682 RepID=A0AAN0JNH9_AMPQE|nr:PREDICTED: uncharacterized protein LOC109586808 [Amphimedon queenslandica]|eukprot:XP_019858581.1 PREDICTED: uncharacterized protein LOC109586808 [Amphimedon queenslandica]